MQEEFIKNLLPVKYGLLIALATLAYGLGLGGAFGAFEDNIKGYLKDNAIQVLSVTYKGDKVLMKKITDKSWVYFKRAHLHANGLGTTALILIFLVSCLPSNNIIKSINAVCLGLGSLGYSLFWMLAGLRAPGIGSTGMAKESLKWLAIPSAGLCIIGLAMVIWLVVISLFLRERIKLDNQS